MESNIESPVRGDIFTISAPADGRELGVMYHLWDFDPDKIRLISSEGFRATFEVLPDAESGPISIALSATHQNHPTGDHHAIFTKTITKSFDFDLDDTSSTNPSDPLTASFSGSTYITANSMGSWNAVADGGTPPYQYSWWIERSDGTGGDAYQIGTGSHLSLTTTSSGRPKYTYYNLYLKVSDSSSPKKSHTTGIKVIGSTGLLQSPF